MDSTWPAFFTVLGVFTLAIVSPGPNFILVTNTALGGSRRSGLLTACGVATGSGLFAAAGLAGLLVAGQSRPEFAWLLRSIGGGYLAWVGFDMLRRCRRMSAPDPSGATVDRDGLRAFRTGLLTNLTNPKAWAFYLSLFTLVTAPGLPSWSRVLLGVAMFLISLAWYALVALTITDRRVQPLFLAWRPVLQGGLGGVLMVLAVKLVVG